MDSAITSKGQATIPKAIIAGVIGCVLQAAELIVEHEHEVVALKRGRRSFADALISALGTRAGCEFTVTFDRQALRLRGFARP